MTTTDSTTETVMFGAGCFWGVQQRFDALPGVRSTEVGYADGTTEHPTYQEVCTGATGHTEVVKVDYDPATVSIDDLLTAFFEMHNPTLKDRQGPDVGTQYRSAVYWSTDAQREATASKIAAIDGTGRWGRPIVTEVAEAGPFWRAEEYHQKYNEKNGRAACPTGI
ncbi:MAG: peptide-methionine (S)-S-oxide reductase MsrA [Planctomycetota bacterium]